MNTQTCFKFDDNSGRCDGAHLTPNNSQSIRNNCSFTCREIGWTEIYWSTNFLQEELSGVW